MENIPLLKSIVLLMAVSVPMSILLTRAGIPTVIGFLLTGIIIGPSGFGVVSGSATIDTLARVGMVLLLFTIGLEFSLSKMLNIRREGIIGGGLQVAVTVAIVTVAANAGGLPFKTALLIGFIIAPSSTAIVLKMFMDRGEVSGPQGNLSVAILLFQDICVVLMVMLVQMLGDGHGVASGGVILGLAYPLAAFAGMVVAIAYVIPKIFNQVVRLRSREIFVLTTVLVCLGSAWLASLFGLSLEVGAFIAGLAISESEYSSQIVADVVPFRDTFASLFFISIGMLLDAHFFAGHIPAVLIATTAILCVKTLAIVAVGQVLKYPLRLSIAVGLILSQIGEFSFILMKMGRSYAMLGDGLYQTLLATTILSMAATPFIFKSSSRLAFGTAHLFKKTGRKTEDKKAPYANHVIIIGFGLNGRNLASVLKKTGIHHVVVDINIESIKKAKAGGHKALYGDAAHPEILKNLGISAAKMLVVAISDPVSTRRIVKASREINPAVSIIVRTRYIKEVEELYRLGASQVIPEEFETSVEIFARVLKDYRVPGNIIQNQIDLIRQEGYSMLRNPSITGEHLQKLTSILEASLMDTFYVDAASPIAHRTIAETNLRKLTGASIIAVVRHGSAKTNPAPDFIITPGDILVILGSHAELNAAVAALKEK
ncbi:hypothetical protein EPN18_08890 [bacterium]|nr:MAG: hypothetical protein EPN18_08890 [bacterium]